MKRANCVKKDHKSGSGVGFTDPYRIPDHLDFIQFHGILFGLKDQQVLDSRFTIDSFHSLVMVKELKDFKHLTSDEAFEVVKDLREHQVEGIKAGLTLKQVKMPHFTSHLMQRISDLMQKQKIEAQAAYKLVYGLDFLQVSGVLSGLTIFQVTSANFNTSTFYDAVELLKSNDQSMSLSNAFDSVCSG